MPHNWWLLLCSIYVTHISARGACNSEKPKGHHGVNMKLLMRSLFALTPRFCYGTRYDAVANCVCVMTVLFNRRSSGGLKERVVEIPCK